MSFNLQLSKSENIKAMFSAPKYKRKYFRKICEKVIDN